MLGKQRSLDGLISHLVDSIALCGKLGALPSDFATYVKSYYEDSSPSSAQDPKTTNNVPSRPKPTPNIDRPFLEHVWKWLVKRPDITVGEHAGHKRLTLSQVEARNAAIEAELGSESGGPAAEYDRCTASPRACRVGRGSRKSVAIQIGGDSEQSAQHYTASGESGAQEPCTGSQNIQIRPTSDEKLLVSQAEVNGSNKLAGNASKKALFQSGIRLYTSQNRMWHAITGHGPDFSKVKSLDFVCLSVIAASGPKGVLQHHLIRITGQDKRSLPSRTDRLHDGGYIVKKRETVWEGNPRRMLHTSRCTLMRYAKDPTAQVNESESIVDAESFTARKRINQRKRAWKDRFSNDANQIKSSSLVTANQSRALMAQSEPQLIPQWTSDRSISNQIFDLVDRSGTQGLSANDIREGLFGVKVRKITEDYVSRLTERWQVSQPLHLRHLAIVRDTLLRGKSQIYIHYSYANFKKLVEAGTAFWEAVITVPEDFKIGNNVAAALNAKPDVDEYGFPRLDASQFQGRFNDATLAECVAALNAGPYKPTRNSPRPKKQAAVIQGPLSGGSAFGQNDDPQSRRASVKSVQDDRPRSPTNETTGPSLTTTQVEDADSPPTYTFLTRQVNRGCPPGANNQAQERIHLRKPGKSLGRPRKYPKSGIPKNIDTMTPREIKNLRNSQEMAEKYERTKIENEIVTRTEGGEDATFVTNEVLTAADTLRKWDKMEPLPSFTRAQILHKFAGGPAPESVHTINDDPWSVMPSSYFLPKFGRPPKPKYWPSMAAHTVFVPGVARANEDAGVRSMRSGRPRQRKSPIVTQNETAENRDVSQCLPSISADSWLHQLARASMTETQQIKPKVQIKKREPKENQHIVSQHEYIPSIAGHSGSLLPLKNMPSPTLTRKRRRTTGAITVQDEDAASSESSPGVTYIAPTNVTRKGILETTGLTAGGSDEGAYPGWKQFMAKYYEHQLDVIARPSSGLFFGDTNPRRKRLCEPSGFRPLLFKVAIFKSALLRKFDWFRAESQMQLPLQAIPQKKSLGCNEQGTAILATGLRFLLQTSGPLTDPLDGLGSTPLQPTLLNRPDDQPDSTYVSPYAKANGTKRKRQDSSQSVRSLENLVKALSSDGSPSSAETLIVPLKPRLLPSDATSTAARGQTNSCNADVVQTADLVPNRPSLEEPPRSSAPDYLCVDEQGKSHDDVSPTADATNIARGSTTTLPDGSVVHQNSGSETHSRMQSLIVTLKLGTLLGAGVQSEHQSQAYIDGPLKLNRKRSALDRPNVASSAQPTIVKTRIASQISASIHVASPMLESTSLASPTNLSRTNSSNTGQSPGYELTKATSPQPDSTTAETGNTQPRQKKRVGRMTRLGGSVALLRKKIIMDLIERCDGIFPSHREIVLPFTAEWTKRGGQDGTPDSKTVLSVVNQLCAEDKLRKITFSFRNKYGIVTTKTMLTFPDIDSTDPRVKETQTQIAAHHPRLYIPTVLLTKEDGRSTSTQPSQKSGENQIPGEETEEGTPNPSLPDIADIKRRRWGLNMLRGKSNVVQARLEALRAQDREDAEGHDNSRPTAGLQTELSATGDSSNPLNVMLVVPPDPPRAPPRPRWRPDERIIRLRGLQSMEATDDRCEPPFTLPPLSVDFDYDQNSLTWLPAQYAFTDYNFEEDRPTLVEPATDQSLRRWTRISKTVRFTEPREEPSQRMKQIAENAARIERIQAEKKPAKPYLLYPDVLPDDFQSPYGPMNLPSPLASTPGLQQTPYISPYAQGGQHDKSIIPTPDSRRRSTGRSQRSAPLTFDLARRASLASDSTGVSPDPDMRAEDGAQPILDIGISQTEGSQPKLQRAALVGFMDPVHYFNRLTGTFYVSFTGIGPPRTRYGGRGTALHPYAHGIQGRSRKRQRIDEDATPFEKEVDAVLNEELAAVGTGDNVFTGWPMVNYKFPHLHITAQKVVADEGDPRHDGRKLKSARPRIARNVLSKGARDISAAASEALKRIQIETPMKRRRLTSLAKEIEGRIQTSVNPDTDGRPAKIRRVRGPKEARSLGPDGERRLITAAIVVRTLTGGLEKIIDWVLVAKAFEGIRDQMFIHRKWNHVLQKHKFVVPKLEEDFQNMFLVAYEEGTVPPLDFDNLASYDWKWLVEWAMDRTGTALRSQPELSAERCDFDDLYTFNDTVESNHMYDYYETHGFASTVKRNSAVNRSAFVYPLDSKIKAARSESKEQLAIAKTWVRANVITPEESYDGNAARVKLSSFPSTVIEDALKELLLDRVLAQENKGRVVPGRNYDIHEYVLTRLKRNLLPRHFKRACAYKETLDRKFAEKGYAPYSFTADDGDVIAITNMLAHKRIKLVPIKVPVNKWGLTEGGYESRQMNKRRLNFNMEIRPSSTYVEAIPLSPLPPPPSQHLQQFRAKIPLWYDIHDHFVPVMWDMAVAAVLALLTVRPGIDAGVIEQGLRPAMEVWEIELVLEWLVEAKAAWRVEKGYAVGEWWWMALGALGDL